MMNSEFGMIMAIMLLCFLTGMIVGRATVKRQRNAECEIRNEKLPEYDYYNPINAREVRTVTECGREWTVYGGQRNGN